MIHPHNIHELKALSIRQPWAWLICEGHIVQHGPKDIENRTWGTKRRGEFLIHTGKTIDKYSYEDMVELGYDLPPMDELITGGIVGITTLVDCVTESDSHWFINQHKGHGFVLADSRPLPFIPCKGALSFFKPDLSSMGECHEEFLKKYAKFDEENSLPRKMMKAREATEQQ